MPLPFEHLDAFAIAVVCVAYAFGFYVRGSFGFGSNLPAVVITAWVLGPHYSVLLASLVATCSQIHMMPTGMREANWRRALPVVIAMAAGSALGVWMLKQLSSDWLLLVLGLVVAAMVLTERLNLVTHMSRFVDVRSPQLAALLGSVSSSLGTVAGGGAMYLLVPFLRVASSSTAEFRSTNIMIGGLNSLLRILLLSSAGLVTLELMIDALALLPLTLVAAMGGAHFFRAASPERFFKALQRMLLLAAALLIVKGVVVVSSP